MTSPALLALPKSVGGLGRGLVDVGTNFGKSGSHTRCLTDLTGPLPQGGLRLLWEPQPVSQGERIDIRAEDVSAIDH
jgi:hypothetical protein